MSSLFTTDLAAVSTGSKLYLYYQDDNNSIRETTSDDGSKWTSSSTAVGGDSDPNGSPITAYYVKADGTSGGESTIHVIYLDSHKTLREHVKVLSKGSSWTEIPLPDDIKKAPIETSRLSSGTCHDRAPGAHQWAFFVQSNTETGAIEVAEIRNGQESDFKWVHRKTLPSSHDATLPGTSIAASLTDPVTYLFFQDHDGDILQYEGGYEKWFNNKTLVPKEKVQISTPLATAVSAVADKPHVFYVASGGKSQIHDASAGDEVIGTAVAGTKLGATVMGEKVFLFHKAVAAPTAVSVAVYDGKGWGKDSVVVA